MLAQLGLGAMQRQRQRGLHALLRQQVEHTAVAYGRKHQVFVADGAFSAEHVDGLEHIVEIVGRLTHAHKHHFFHCAYAARKDHLREDFQAAYLPNQAAFAGHAEAATNSATDLRRHAEPIARQQHTFNHLPVSQPDQQAFRIISARMPGMNLRHGVELFAECRQAMTYRQRQEVFLFLAAWTGVKRLAV